MVEWYSLLPHGMIVPGMNLSRAKGLPVWSVTVLPMFPRVFCRYTSLHQKNRFRSMGDFTLPKLTLESLMSDASC